MVKHDNAEKQLNTSEAGFQFLPKENEERTHFTDDLPLETLVKNFGMKYDKSLRKLAL